MKTSIQPGITARHAFSLVHRTWKWAWTLPCASLPSTSDPEPIQTTLVYVISCINLFSHHASSCRFWLTRPLNSRCFLTCHPVRYLGSGSLIFLVCSSTSCCPELAGGYHWSVEAGTVTEGKVTWCGWACSENRTGVSLVRKQYELWNYSCCNPALFKPSILDLRVYNWTATTTGH